MPYFSLPVLIWNIFPLLSSLGYRQVLCNSGLKLQFIIFIEVLVVMVAYVCYFVEDLMRQLFEKLKDEKYFLKYCVIQETELISTKH